MNDPLPASNWHQLGTGYDANIPHGLSGQTRIVSAWAGTLQLSAFIALVILPIILVTEAWQAPTGAAATALACAGARRSFLRYLRIRVS
ncbi:hypothetical protein ABZ192_28925 [Streptomyces sp. NPDC006235]|uniref:hypothetical protein n=1 Tax=Streptomyces sp. NPDC006235 TaxID=3156736 RepID=UPI0033AB1D0F